MKEVFNKIYQNRMWRTKNDETYSGAGSTLLYASNFIKKTKEIIDKFQIKSILDLSCGDWNWMKELHLDETDIKYVGIDIVDGLVEHNKKLYEASNINFYQSDMLEYLKNNKCEEFDLIVCRQTLEHLPNNYIEDVLREVRKCNNYFLTTTSPGCPENKDMWAGGYRCIDLSLTPFVEILGDSDYIFYDTKDTAKNEINRAKGILYRWRDNEKGQEDVESCS